MSENRTEISSLGEFGLIEHLTGNIEIKNVSTLVGVGDDAAVIDHFGKQTVLTTDLLLEDVHFDLLYTPLQHLGYKSVVVNLSEGGVGLRTNLQDARVRASLSVGEEIGLRFELPETGEMFDVAGTVVWTTAAGCGVRFGYIPEAQRSALQQWLTECVERSLTRLCERIRAACA